MSQTIQSHSQVAMPFMLYGTAWKKERTAPLVEQAIKAGFRGIDTACQPKHYDEKAVGDGIWRAVQSGIRREEIFVQTKFTSVTGQDPQTIPYDPALPLKDQVLGSFERSQENLRAEVIDSLVLHGPLPSWSENLEVWRTMESLIDKKMVRQIGVSNFYSPELFYKLWEHARIKPAVLQNRFYADTGYDLELRRFCREHHIIYQSFWTLTANPHILRHPVVTSIAAKKQLTTAQVFFTYLLHQGIQPLTGTTSATHMAEDLQVENTRLDEAEVKSISILIQ